MTKPSILFYAMLFYSNSNSVLILLVKAIVADKAMPPCLLLLWTIDYNLLEFYNSIQFKTVVTFDVCDPRLVEL